ncbi:MAG: hypothetical protein EPN82_04500 [Bacteroidetes bacterium]|nr:MAG: hypothetical protein EPN82_04500 [Bacteroidota bacterium]
MRIIKFFLMFLLPVILFSCKDNPASNPIIFDDSDLFINNDSTLEITLENFDGVILNNHFTWVERFDRRQSIHGWGGYYDGNKKLMSYEMGYNTYPIFNDDYILRIYTPKFKQGDFNKLKELLFNGEKIIEGNNFNKDSLFRIYLTIVDESNGNSGINKSREYSSEKGSQENSYFRILSKFVKFQYDYYMIKIKAELKVNLYDKDGIYIGTVQSKSLVLGVFVEKKLFDCSK